MKPHNTNRIPKEIVAHILSYHWDSWMYTKENISFVLEMGKVLRKTRSHLRFMLLFTPVYFESDVFPLTYSWAVDQLHEVLDTIELYRQHGCIVQHRMTKQCLELVEYYMKRHVPKDCNDRVALLKKIRN